MCMYDYQWHDMTMYNLIMPQKSVIKVYNIKSISHHYIWLHETLSILLWLHLTGNRTHFPPAELVCLSTFQDLTKTTFLISNSECDATYIIFCISINTDYSFHWPLIPMTIISQQNSITNCKVSNPLFPYLPYL